MSVKFHTPPATLSFPHFDKPMANKQDPSKEAKYSGAFVFAPTTDFTAMRAAILEAAVEFFGVSFKGKPTAEALDKGVLQNPLTDGEKKNHAPGSLYFNARSNNKPGLVYPHADPADTNPDPTKRRPEKVPAEKIVEVFYAGAKVRASVSFFGYENSGHRGVGVGLNNVQKIGEGPRLDNRKAAEDEFDVDLSATPASLDDVI